ncbi:hypothetical protein DFJ74DRAFT_674531 [Hyaloraphidium curvatum]|nr:hypothetical protein DFJ74DRAFT_674531 [Hyaloraphidium curvatum]
MSFGKQVMRSTKNLVKGYTDVQVKVREATSNDPWGPSGTLMQEIADCTYNHKDFMDIMEIVDKRLNDSGKNWRHVFKALILLDYLLHAGSEAIIAYTRENMYVIKTLKEFQYVDEDGKDQGANVRQKCKEITMLLADEARLKEERRTRKDMVSRMGPTDDWGYGNDGYGSRSGTGSQSPTSYNRDAELPPTPSVARPAANASATADDADLQRALEESRRTAAEDERKRAMLTRAVTESDDDLQRALRLSEAEARQKEEERRRQMSRRQPEPDLFDFNSPAIQTNVPMYQRTDSAGNMGFGGQGGYYGQQGYPQQPMGYGGDYGGGGYGGTNSGYQQPYGAAESNPFGTAPNGGDSGYNPFGAAFDGGSGARPLPHQIAGGTPNAQIASIARNAVQIDPFANLASSRGPSISAQVGMSSGYGDSQGFGDGSAPNPFGAPQPADDPFAALATAPKPAPTRSATGPVAAKPASRFVPSMNIASSTATPTNYGAASDYGGLVNLSSSALSSAPKPAANNPFGAVGSDAGAGQQLQWNAAQPSLNAMAAGPSTQGQNWNTPQGYGYGQTQQAQAQQFQANFF